MKVKALFLLVAVLVLKVQINLKEINRFTNCRHSAFTIDFRFFCLRYLLLVDFSGKHYVNHSPRNSFSNVYLFLWLNHCCFSTGCQSTKKSKAAIAKAKKLEDRVVVTQAEIKALTRCSALSKSLKSVRIQN